MANVSDGNKVVGNVNNPVAADLADATDQYDIEDYAVGQPTETTATEPGDPYYDSNDSDDESGFTAHNSGTFPNG